jgi:hypothetical protein
MLEHEDNAVLADAMKLGNVECPKLPWVGLSLNQG